MEAHEGKWEVTTRTWKKKWIGAWKMKEKHPKKLKLTKAMSTIAGTLDGDKYEEEE